MSKIAQWKRIFGHTEKQKVLVQVSGRTEAMTETQSYRFEELTRSRVAGEIAADRNPLEDSQYGLQDASLRLMITEDQLLQKAAAGLICLYVDITGLQGHWQRNDAAGELDQPALAVSKSGLLALDQKACEELAASGTAQVLTLFIPPASNLAILNIDPDTQASLLAWGGSRQFCLRDPLCISRDDIRLLPPLVLPR
ncbi:MAG TPA: hypothetical protein PKK10_00615 [Woeseiaceae bacterium]|nr:hypothetical protein [Woeseiaceae bacterium]